MDLIGHVLVSLAGGVATGAGQGLYEWLKERINKILTTLSHKDIVKTLEEIGNLADADIRKRVDELARLKQIPKDRVEELTTLLINLAHGARFHTTHGTPNSSFARSERFLDQLLQRVLPKRRKGEPVAENGLPGWQLARFLGMGGFGEVWEAQNPDYPDSLAIKFFTSPDAEQWAKAEQKTLFEVQRQLPKHPNLVSFRNVALTGKPFPYLELEYANGGSLEEWILRQPEDRLELDKNKLIEGVVRGLAQAHEHGIVHRDLKPANVLLLCKDGDVIPKLADFGLGRAQPNRAESSGQSSQGLVVGTSMYLPPESMQAFVHLSPEKNDVFAVGVIWYQLLVGRLERPPYDFADRLREHLADSQTIRVIERCLAQPSRRFPDGCELEQAIDALPRVPDWTSPPECFDVQHLGREYVASKA